MMRYRLVDIHIETKVRTEWSWFSVRVLHILQDSLKQRFSKLNLKKVKTHIEYWDVSTGEIGAL